MLSQPDDNDTSVLPCPSFLLLKTMHDCSKGFATRNSHWVSCDFDNDMFHSQGWGLTAGEKASTMSGCGTLSDCLQDLGGRCHRHKCCTCKRISHNFACPRRRNSLFITPWTECQVPRRIFNGTRWSSVDPSVVAVCEAMTHCL